jgi:hypothetical protein
MPPLYFNSQHLPTAQPEYVTWIDVMGIGPTMGRSLDMAANFVFKLHVAALQAPQNTMTLYPIMDGLYAASPDKQAVLDFVGSVFSQCAQEFMNTPQDQQHHRFIIRGAIAYGPVIHGRSVPPAATQGAPVQPNVFVANQVYRDAILIGLPMVQAHTTEPLAPPYGLYVHESARTFAPAGQQPIHFNWWKWSQYNNAVWQQLSPQLLCYFDWCKQRSQPLGYKSERIEAHREVAEQYFEQ